MTNKSLVMTSDLHVISLVTFMTSDFTCQVPLDRVVLETKPMVQYPPLHHHRHHHRHSLLKKSKQYKRAEKGLPTFPLLPYTPLAPFFKSSSITTTDATSYCKTYSFYLLSLKDSVKSFCLIVCTQHTVGVITVSITLYHQYDSKIF